MAIIFNYVTDYGQLVGWYPTYPPLIFLQFLPSELRNLFIEQNNFKGCRTNNLIPRKVRLNFDGENNRQEIELPVRPTINQLKVIKSNSSAIYVETIGEKITYSRLRWAMNNG